MSVYECLCIYVCVYYLFFYLFVMISSWESYRSDFMSSSQLLCIVFQQIVIYLYLFQCLAKLSELFDDCFPGKVFPFFPLVERKEAILWGSLQKISQIKQSYLEMCNMLVYWLALKSTLLIVCMDFNLVPQMRSIWHWNWGLIKRVKPENI